METLMLCLGKNHPLFLTNTIHVLWTHIPNMSSLLSVLKCCIYTTFQYLLTKFLAKLVTNVINGASSWRNMDNTSYS